MSSSYQTTSLFPLTNLLFVFPSVSPLCASIPSLIHCNSFHPHHPLGTVLVESRRTLMLLKPSLFLALIFPSLGSIQHNRSCSSLFSSTSFTQLPTWLTTLLLNGREPSLPIPSVLKPPTAQSLGLSLYSPVTASTPVALNSIHMVTTPKLCHQPRHLKLNKSPTDLLSLSHNSFPPIPFGDQMSSPQRGLP